MVVMKISFKLPRLFLLILLLIPGISGIHSQQLSFSYLNSENGLSNNIITSVIQDNKGFMWFGTHNGLNRFDGYNIKVYKNNDSDTTSLLDNFILCLYTDREGTLWIGNLNGISRYNCLTDNFTRFPVSEAESQGFKTEPLGSITEDKEGNIWYGNRNGGVYKFKHKTNTYVYYDYPSKSVSKLFIDKDNNIYAGTRDSEIYYFDIQSNRFILSTSGQYPSGTIPDNFVRNIYQNYEGKIIMNASHGIFEVDPRKGTSKLLHILPEKFTSFRNNEIRYVYEENPDIIWIGTWGKGLYKYNRKEGNLVNFQVDPDNNASLSNNDVNTIYKDRGGVIWVSTQDGITIIDPVKVLFRKYQNTPKNPQSLHFNFVTSFHEDLRGNIWIGTYGGGISIFNPDNESFRKLVHDPSNSNSISNNAIRGICEDNTGNIWIGTMNGLDVYNPITGKFIHYVHDPDNPNSLSSNDVLCVIKGNKNDIWVGTFGGGLNRVLLPDHKHREPVFETFNSKQEGPYRLASDYIRSLLIDDEGYLWVGNLGAGLNRVNTINGQTLHYSSENFGENILCNNNINTICAAKNGFIWAGTWGGISRIDPLSGEITNITMEHGLPDHNIAEIQEADDGSIWVSTFKGIVKISFDEGDHYRLTVYNTRNGLQGNKFNINASLKASTGELYFGGTTGFNIIDPSRVNPNEYVPPVVLTKISVFNEEVKINEKINRRIILNKSITDAESITLSHQDKIFSIEFSGLSFSEMERNQFKYMLEGLDKQWVTVDSKRRFATYSNLDKGIYTFRVLASNSDGMWNSEGVALNIRVLPPPWKTWWAFIIYGLITFGGLLIIRRYSIIQARLQHKLELDALERKKTEEINQMKFSFFTNISHELRTPLTLILGPLENLLSQKQLPSTVLDHLYMMNRNASRLMNMVNQLLDFRKIEMGKLALEFSENDIVNFVYEVKRAFDDFAKQHQFEYVFTSSLKKQMVWIDANKFEMALYNILSNAFKFIKHDGKIQVEIESGDKARGRSILKKLADLGYLADGRIDQNRSYVIITVSDNGIGIPAERIPKIFERFYQVDASFKSRHIMNQTGTGIGLSITREIIQMHKGNIFVESVYTKGSKFFIVIPVGDEHLNEAQKLRTDHLAVNETATIESVLFSESPELQYIRFEEKLEKRISEEKMNVLVIEDNHDIRRFITGVLSEEFNVLEAENGAEGFELTLKHLPDLILCDIMMPVMDGHSFTKKLKEDVRISHIPVILLTAYNTEQNNIMGFEEGADEYISKPFNSSLLITRIHNLIENRRKLRESFSSDLSVNTSKLALNNMDSRFLEKAVRIIEEKMDDPDFNVVTFWKPGGLLTTIATGFNPWFRPYSIALPTPEGYKNFS
jgi:signal transduction histidine kinase/ligand-binding sensor domain-containing protein/DNA-binding response OmpR family regulator